MNLPTVTVTAVPGEPPVVTVNGARVDGVRKAQIGVAADQMPQIILTLTAAVVECDLPAGVAVLQAGPTARAFADGINPARLEALAHEHLELDDQTTGEAFTGALLQLAGEFDAAPRA